MMGFKDAILTCLRKYATFSGRASRSEFWWFTLFAAVLYGIVSTLSGIPLSLFAVGYLSGSPLLILVFLFLLLPLTAAGFRRLHDIGWPGWPMLFPIVMVPTHFPAAIGVMAFGNAANLDENVLLIAMLLISLVVAFGAPIVGIIAAIVLLMPSQRDPNKYGPNPLEASP